MKRKKLLVYVSANDRRDIVPIENRKLKKAIDDPSGETSDYAIIWREKDELRYTCEAYIINHSRVTYRASIKLCSDDYNKAMDEIAEYFKTAKNVTFETVEKQLLLE